MKLPHVLGLLALVDGALTSAIPSGGASHLIFVSETAAATGTMTIQTIGGPSHLIFVPHTTTTSMIPWITSMTSTRPIDDTFPHNTGRPTNIGIAGPSYPAVRLPLSLVHSRSRQARGVSAYKTTSKCARPASGPFQDNFIEQPPTADRPDKCKLTCDSFYNACLRDNNCKDCPGEWSNGPNFASPCSEKCIVDTCKRKFFGQNDYMCNVECGYESLQCMGPIVSLFKPTIVNPEPTAKVKMMRGEANDGTCSPVATTTSPSGRPRDTFTAIITMPSIPKGRPRGTLPGTATTSYLTRPRDTLIGPVLTELATAFGTLGTTLGHPRDTMDGPVPTELATVFGTLGTIRGHPRDTMTVSSPIPLH